MIYGALRMYKGVNNAPEYACMHENTYGEDYDDSNNNRDSDSDHEYIEVEKAFIYAFIYIVFHTQTLSDNKVKA